MTDREQLVDELFAQAVDLSTAERERFLSAHAADANADAGVLDEVKALLTNFRRADEREFLQDPLIGDKPTQALADGQDFQGYRILRLIAEGGMGEVYLAEDRELNRKVAIKLTRSHLKSRDLLRRFQNERRILANLQHPNIAQLCEAGATPDGQPFFVMEYIEGLTIDKFVADHQLTIPERLRLFRTVCSAVSYAHQNLVVHRDIKPGNILVRENGEPKLLDFGIARLLEEDNTENVDATVTMFRALTPQYASPEQIRGAPVTTASDVYSLGVVLYEILTGRRPYRVTQQTADEIARAVCDQEPAKPSSLRADAEIWGYGDTEKKHTYASPRRGVSPSALRGDLDNIVLKALRKEPERRYSSVEQFSEDIRRHLDGLPVTATADTLAYRTTKFIKRHKFGMAAATVIIMILTAGIITTSVAARRARLQSARAEQRFNQVRELAHSVLFDYHDAIASLPGSTPVRERLVKDALKYLDDLASDPSNSPALQRELATAYLKVGDVQGRPYAPNLGHTDDALASYQKALKILETVSDSSASDRDLKRELATVYERIGNIHLRKGNFDAAFEVNVQALRIRQDLLAADQSDSIGRREVADSYLYVGDALQAKCSAEQCLRDALADQQRALQIRQALADENPNDLELKRGVAQAHMRIGFRMASLASLTKEKDYTRQWLDEDRAALAITRELVAANRTNAIDRRNLADELMATANAQIENNDHAGALSGYTESLEIFKALAASDPTNSEAQRDLGFIYLRLGALSRQTGKTDSAREYYAHALEVVQQLLAQGLSDEEDLATGAVIYVDLDALAEASGDLDAAIDARKHEIELRERIVALDPNTANHLYDLAGVYQLTAQLYAKQGGAHYNSAGGVDVSVPRVITAQQAEQWREARRSYENALRIFEDLKSKGKLEANYAKHPQAMRDYMAMCDSFLARVPK